MNGTSASVRPQRTQWLRLGTFLAITWISYTLGFLGGHPEVAVAVGEDALEGLAGVLGDDAEELRAGFLDFPGRDEDVAGLALGAAQRLMDQHAGMRQGRALAFRAGAQQDGAHGRRHAGAHGGHVRLDNLHRVIDGETRRNLAAGGVQVHRDVRARVRGGQEQELGHDDVGHVIVDGNAQEDDAVHHQAAEHVHLGDVQLALLGNGRVDVGVEGRRVAGQGGGADALAFHGKFLEFVHVSQFW